MGEIKNKNKNNKQTRKTTTTTTKQMLDNGRERRVKGKALEMRLM